MKKTDIAYAAGLIDGEAYIGIKKTSRLYNGRVNPQYQERIQIRMVHEGAIFFIANMFGGNYYKESPSAANGRPLYCYQSSDRKAIDIINKILPYMKVKKESAQILLALRERKNNPDRVAIKQMIRTRWGNVVEATRWRHSEVEISKREELYQKCKRINAVGV